MSCDVSIGWSSIAGSDVSIENGLQYTLKMYHGDKVYVCIKWLSKS